MCEKSPLSGYRGHGCEWEKSGINGEERGSLVSCFLAGKHLKTSQHRGEDIIRSSAAIVGDQGAGLQEQPRMPVESASCFLLVRHTLVIYMNVQRQVVVMSLPFSFGDAVSVDD